MGGKVWKEEEEEEGCWREGVAGAGPREHLSGNRPGRGAGSGEGTSGPGTRVSPAMPALPGHLWVPSTATSQAGGFPVHRGI